MLSKFFKANQWGEMGVMELEFFDVTLLIQIGEFQPGTKFDYAYANFDSGILQLSNNKEEFFKEFNMYLIVAEK